MWIEGPRLRGPKLPSQGLGLYWGYIGVTLGLYLGYIGVIFGVILGLYYIGFWGSGLRV